MAIVDLQKAFDRVPQKVIRWAMRKRVLYQWIKSRVYGMYENVRRSVRVGVSVTILRGRSVYTRALGSVHIIVLDALSQYMCRFKLSAFTRKWVIHWTEATIEE